MQQNTPAADTIIFTPEDVSTMRDAFLLVHTEWASEDATADDAALGKAIIRLYRMGLVEPTKLAAVAVMLASAKESYRPAQFPLS